jgi:hypothetical protein
MRRTRKLQADIQAEREKVKASWPPPKTIYDFMTLAGHDAFRYNFTSPI